MSRQSSQKRPWLAAGLTLLVVGLGQFYLRRWLRALGWVSLAVVTTLVFVPQSVLTDPAAASFWDGAPLAFVGLLSVFDAYVLATQHNVRLESQNPETPRCPACHRELEANLTFCQWCANELPEGEAANFATTDETDGDS
ncbi:DUF7575 domain-containing protein [Natronobacterium gregoryi]|uniref:Zinc ribbon domain-containing protein n=2 Tax=Natronobacterium gregoryi TaxID=44930 RepID=L0AF75_NATGS|nr:hypothetical protein [Natronobacterium gregoryi]AFZ72491.1 hypothetical protein Natgr_1268 [Natronobacterium gregoryi SP2]ELY74363.1 hypothetical protein C490_00300 [Natronobacterium gregoryi SP2]PLK21462.1 zinc ribbon domain-containing protein [Natronobacterium gregoryi SP2]SFI77261.1 hypothetical protein SAMN05443661_10575 [Natronobacterium gregoryi]